MTTTELTTTSQANLPVDAELLKEFGGMDEAPVDTSDIIIPKILLGHPQSTAVKEEKVKVNTAYDSVSKSTLIPKGDHTEIILFSMFKTWVIKAKKGNKFIAEEPFTPENANRPREGDYQVGDQHVQVDFNKTVNYFAILPEQLKNGSASLPYVISFQRTALKTSRMIETERLRLQGHKVPLFFKVWNIKINMVSNDLGEWPMFDLALARNSTREELRFVEQWKQRLGQVKYQVDSSEEGSDEAGEAQSTESVSSREF